MRQRGFGKTEHRIDLSMESKMYDNSKENSVNEIFQDLNAYLTKGDEPKGPLDFLKTTEADQVLERIGFSAIPCPRA